MHSRWTRPRSLIVGIALVALVATGCRWNFEVLDGHGGAHGRLNNTTGGYSTGVVYNGRPHVFYYDYVDETLRHAYHNGSFWAFETLDGNGGGAGRVNSAVGFNPTATVSGNRLRVFYYDIDAKALRHAYYVPGGGWGFETLDGNGGPNGRTIADVGRFGAALDYRGRPQVFYYDFTNGLLRRGEWTGHTWIFENFDGDFNGARGRISADVGDVTNATAVYDWVPHVFYWDRTDGYLRHGYWDGANWQRETIDGNGAGNGRVPWDAGQFPSVVMYNGRPHVFYQDTHFSDLRHGYYADGAWFFETLDGHRNGPNGQTSSSVGDYSSATLVGGKPNVFYNSAGESTQRRGWWTGNEWRFQTFDGIGGPDGQVNHLTGWDNAALRSGGTPHVFSYDPTAGTLRHAWFG
ncbi:MAG: hypothetical protein R3A49_11865 [Acidimicrobiia bacterium]